MAVGDVAMLQRAELQLARSVTLDGTTAMPLVALVQVWGVDMTDVDSIDDGTFRSISTRARLSLPGKQCQPLSCTSSAIQLL
jgi:hypothetical protein